MRGRFIEDGLFSYKVLSVHDRAINLADGKKELVVSLIGDSENMTALSLLTPDMFSRNETRKIREGDVFNRRDFDFDQSEIWTGIPGKKKCNGERQTAQIKIIEGTMDPGSSFLSILTNSEQDIYQRKASEILERGFENIEMLVGLGLGMTPAGDDFITGVLLAEAMTYKGKYLNRTRIRERLNKTTPAGRTLLHLALGGSFPAYLLKYVDSTAESENEDDVLAAVRRASQHGSTSGLDSLAGYYWFFENALSHREKA